MQKIKIMLKKIPFILILLLVACTNTTAQQFRPSSEGVLIDQVLQRIRAFYVEEVDTQVLVEAAIRAMMDQLDEYSVFHDAESTRETNEAMSGVHSWYGIGIQFNMRNDTVNVVEVVSGGPAQRVGLLPGDRVILINDTIVSGVQMNQLEVVSRFRGPRGEPVDIQVLRRGIPELLPFRMIRERIPNFSIDASYMVTDNIGYIHISRFAATTGREFREAQRALRAQGMEHLILDLSGNGGGILQVAPAIASEFMEGNRLVVYTEGRTHQRMTLNTTRGGELHSGRVVVIVNEASASASEILAGALQDWDRAVIVGRRTHGKGTVQQQHPLPDGSMIRLTVARYFTPTSRGVHRLYDINDIVAYNADPVNQLLRGEISLEEFPDSLKFTTLVNNRMVLGGGGITPDYVVPRNRGEGTLLHLHLSARGIILFTAVDEVDNNRDELLRRYPNPAAFLNNYRVPQRLIDELRRRAENENVEWNNEQFEQSREIILRHMRAIMARQLFDSSAFSQVINQEDEAFQEALSIISNPERHQNLLRGVGSNVGTRALIPPATTPTTRPADGRILVEPQVPVLIDEE